MHLLVIDCVILDGVRFVGSTLWTDYALDASRTSPAARDADIAWAMRNAEGLLEDHRAIATGTTTRGSDGLRPMHALPHITARAYLESVLEVPHDGPTVVVTHHAPALLSIAPRFLGNPLNPAFASDLTAMILRYRPNAVGAWARASQHRLRPRRDAGRLQS